MQVLNDLGTLYNWKVESCVEKSFQVGHLQPRIAKIWKRIACKAISTITARRIFLEYDFQCCRGSRKLPIINVIRNRIARAKEHLKLTEDQQEKVIFSGESAFQVNNHSKSRYVLRRKKEEQMQSCILSTIKLLISVMV